MNTVKGTDWISSTLWESGSIKAQKRGLYLFKTVLSHWAWYPVSCCSAGLGGACGYLTGAMDWGHSALGALLGSEYQVIYFFSALTWGFFLTVHLFSIPEKPLGKQHPTEPSVPDAPLLQPSVMNGSTYGSVTKEPELRPRSFSALSEANSVTSSSQQPSIEVSHLLNRSVKFLYAFFLLEFIELWEGIKFIKWEIKHMPSWGICVVFLLYRCTLPVV